MSLASTDPAVLFANSRCLGCLTPIQQLRAQTYLLAKLAGMDTSYAGVAALSKAAACMSCLTTPELIAVKSYLLALALGLDTSQAGVSALEQAAKCWDCLTPHQQRQVQTYLFAVADGIATDVGGVRAIQAAARCFSCLEKNQQLEVQVYLLTQIVPGAPQTASALAAAAKCFISCASTEIASQLQTSLVAKITGTAIAPCVNPTAPVLKGVNSDLTNGAILQVTWSQLSNAGSLITGYTVFWGTVSGVYTSNSGVLPVTPHQYIINGLNSGTRYFVAVVANTNIGACQSANSNEKSNTTSGLQANGLLNNLIGYWKFDAVAGTDSIGTNNLTMNGGATSGGVAGLINTGLDISTNSSYAEHTDNADFEMGPGVSFTFSAWIFSSNFNADALAHWFLNKFIPAQPLAEDYWLNCNNTGVFFSVFDTGANNVAVTLPAATSNVWNHVVFGFDSPNKQVFAFFNNGAKVTAATVTNGVQASASPFRMGWPGGAFVSLPNQRMDEVGFWKNRVLTASDVNILYNAGAGFPLSSFTV